MSEEEIRARFEREKAGLGTKPPTVDLQQVIITPRPSEDERLRAEEAAEIALSRARAGEDFVQLARELSEDEATRQNGGSLGWVSGGELLPEFEETLFFMRPGQVSDIVETSVGFHIIKLERIRGSERLARHILIRPEVTEEDAEAARQLAERVAAALRDGGDIDSLISLHGDPGESSTLTNYNREQLPANYREAIERAGVGEVVGPVQLSGGSPGNAKWAVAIVSDLRPAGRWTLDDVREYYRREIEGEKTVERIIDNLREITYIETRLERFIS